MHPVESQRAREFAVDVSVKQSRNHAIQQGELAMADVQIEDGIIKVVQLDIQDPKAAAVLAEFPQTRWPEITRRALKIGLGYLNGGGKD
jgi:hypothetical protein